MSASPNLRVTEIKAFVPARDFELSKQFYKDLGFTMASDGGGVAYFHFGDASFLLQNFYEKALAENLMMHLLVEDVEAWRNHIHESGIAAKYKVRVTEIELQPWRMRDFRPEGDEISRWREMIRGTGISSGPCRGGGSHEAFNRGTTTSAGRSS